MKDEIIYLNPQNILHLKLFKAIHPTEVHPKADHWKFIFQLYSSNGEKIHNGYFTNNFLAIEKEEVLLIEQYDESILNEESIKTDEDVITKLRVFNFEKNITGNFSKLIGGGFLIKSFSTEKIIYSKVYYDKTAEFEISLGNIEFEKIK
ncbi:hypothetical protein FEDK69T_31700 [Flavobacterium enshiense DK69]|uniref:Uncharacterized protein n=1 Tax=Flavobacterium enshiense DK69 TaxID=1107311 RepID=V6RZ57_9FLAO|nr:hypothetical protein [Flavobacterium enshiense]ESU19454.1 hypothetical protein FEDK69T_31700 [Flavobacterium enshiense DK69]KGO92164.1 hypothetical protein Q767_15740 [Flavobacterium enshiense DK69]